MDSQLYNRRRSVERSRKFAVRPPRTHVFSGWLLLSLGINVILVGGLVWSLRDRLWLNVPFLSASASENAIPYTPTPPAQWINPTPADQATSDVAAGAQLGPQHRWTYAEWVTQLEREATAMANNPPANLNILLGDSISLWFPYELLPSGPTWLNQGISGEGSAGLLKRLDLIVDTDPQIMYLMIGINDLIRGGSDDTLMANQRLIIQNLRQMHPDAAIVVQTVLPHAGDRSTWEGKDRLLTISNDRIRNLNQQLAQLAQDESVMYLDLQPLFTDADGNLRLDLTTDGLHLNDDGYRVWAAALQLHRELVLEKSVTP